MSDSGEGFLNYNPCYVCAWGRDCPPCNSVAAGEGGESSCYTLDTADSALTVHHETASSIISRAVQFFYRSEAATEGGEIHSLINLFLGVSGKTYSVHGDPMQADPVLWNLHKPDEKGRFCAAESSGETVESLESGPTGTTLIRWFAVQGNYGDALGASSDESRGPFMPISDLECCSDESSSAPSSESSFESCEPDCPCWVPVHADAATLDCGSAEALEMMGLSNRISEVAVELDSAGNIIYAYWGGTRTAGNDCDPYNLEFPLLESQKNYCKWRRDNPREDENGTIIPIMCQHYEIGGLPVNARIFDLYLIHVDCTGKVMFICFYAHIGPCEIIDETVSTLGVCPCWEIACLKMNFTFGGQTPPPLCPVGLIVDCPDAQKPLPDNQCSQAEPDDLLVCSYELSGGAGPIGIPTPEACANILVETGSGPSWHYCTYTLVGECA